MGCYREVQLDEKWAFVSQKEKSCDPLDPLDRLRGDDWDHTAVDPESRLRLALVPGKRDGDACKDLVQQVHNRTAGRTDLLITSDEHAPYETAIKEVYSVERPRPKRRGPGRPPKPERILPADLCYATVRKARARRGVWWRWCGRWSSARCSCWGPTCGDRGPAPASTRRSSSGTTGRIGTRTPGSIARPMASPRTSRSTTPHRTSSGTAIISVGVCVRFGSEGRMVAGSNGLRRWLRD